MKKEGYVFLTLAAVCVPFLPISSYHDDRDREEAFLHFSHGQGHENRSGYSTKTLKCWWHIKKEIVIQETEDKLDVTLLIVQHSVAAKGF